MLAMDVGEGQALTVEDFYAAVKAIEEQPPPEPHRHLVSAAGIKRLSQGGRACCHTCGTILEARDLVR